MRKAISSLSEKLEGFLVVSKYGGIQVKVRLWKDKQGVVHPEELASMYRPDAKYNTVWVDMLGPEKDVSFDHTGVDLETAVTIASGTLETGTKSNGRPFARVWDGSIEPNPELGVRVAAAKEKAARERDIF